MQVDHTDWAAVSARMRSFNVQVPRVTCDLRNLYRVTWGVACDAHAYYCDALCSSGTSCLKPGRANFAPSNPNSNPRSQQENKSNHVQCWCCLVLSRRARSSIALHWHFDERTAEDTGNCMHGRRSSELQVQSKAAVGGISAAVGVCCCACCSSSCCGRQASLLERRLNRPLLCSSVIVLACSCQLKSRCCIHLLLLAAMHRAAPAGVMCHQLQTNCKRTVARQRRCCPCAHTCFMHRAAQPLHRTPSG